MRFAKIVFWIAAGWGVLILVPLYWMLDTVGRESPPPITHPEFYYGFLGVALVWQAAFFIIGADPDRFRPMMVPAMLEKFGHAGAMTVLYLDGALTGKQLGFNLPDLALGILFVMAFVRTRPPVQAGPARDGS